MKRGPKAGFTLIELLVALAILGAIVVICGKIFEQSNVAWNTGAQRAEMSMAGRGIADFIAQDLSRCVARTADELVIDGGSMTFKILDERSVPTNSTTKPIQTVNYQLGGPVTRNGVVLAPGEMVKLVGVKAGPAAAGDLPGYVDIEVQVKEPIENSERIVSYHSRAWLVNRDRYTYDD